MTIKMKCPICGVDPHRYSSHYHNIDMYHVYYSWNNNQTEIVYDVKIQDGSPIKTIVLDGLVFLNKERIEKLLLLL